MKFEFYSISRFVGFIIFILKVNVEVKSGKIKNQELQIGVAVMKEEKRKHIVLIMKCLNKK